MPHIDEHGRLFGLINVVDLLVVILLLVAVSAGALVVIGGDDTVTEAPEEEPTRYATFAYTVSLGTDAAHVDAGDSLQPLGSGDTFEIVDGYRSFASDESTFVLTRVAYSGTPTNSGDRVYAGNIRTFRYDERAMETTVLSVNQTNAEIESGQHSVVIELNRSNSVTPVLEPGQRATIAGDTVATVESVAPATDTDRNRARVGLTIRTWGSNPTRYADRPLRVGNRLTIVTDIATVRGTIAELGTADADGGEP